MTVGRTDERTNLAILFDSCKKACRRKMSPRPFPVLFEDNHLLVIDKPAGLATMGVAEDVPSVLSEAKAYIKRKYDKPGNVYLGVVSRLDAPVTGVLVIARTSKAASRLSRQFREADVEKSYWALVDSPPQPASGRCVDLVIKDDRHRKMYVTRQQSADAREARLRYRTLQPAANWTLLEVELETGRKHQIRLQLSHRGWPIIGDRKYGSSRKFPAGIALHSHLIRFQHPVKDREVSIICPPPPSWNSVGFENTSQRVDGAHDEI